MPIELVFEKKPDGQFNALEFERDILQSMMWWCGYEDGVEKTRDWIRRKVRHRTEYDRLWARYSQSIYEGNDARLSGLKTTIPRFAVIQK